MLRAAANFAILLVALAAFPEEVIDRMVAVVNRQVILQSELEEAERVERLQQGKPVDEMTSQETDAVLDRLIDQALLQQQIVNNSVVEPAADEISSQIHEIRSQIPGAAADEKWRALLAAYGLTEQDVAMRIASQLRILKFIDLRFRILARVDRASISSYYQEKLLPKLRKQGAPEPPLSQVSGKIEQILTEQRINELLNSWLQALRSQAHIEKISSDSKAAAGALQ
jgi:peptidyl-prolyl cis-trans isomerase SurA